MFDREINNNGHTDEKYQTNATAVAQLFNDAKGGIILKDFFKIAKGLRMKCAYRNGFS